MQRQILKNEFAVFILTHGRPDNIFTEKTLRKSGCTGKIYFIIDDEDKTKDQYLQMYGEQVIIFSKKQYENTFDIMDNFKNNKVVVYARNACYDIARKLKLKYFLEYEDDYHQFQNKYILGKTLKARQVKNLDSIFLSMINCMESTPIKTLAFAQGGDFIGGAGSFKNNTFKRKAMNSFLFKVNDNPEDDIKFIGRMNDDVNTYLSQGKIGKIFFQISQVSIVQTLTQQSSGGNTEAYKQSGTYVKSFYSVIAEPSCCKISLMGRTARRIHHRIKWINAVPVIISDKYKKSIN